MTKKLLILIGILVILAGVAYGMIKFVSKSAYSTNAGVNKTTRVVPPTTGEKTTVLAKINGPVGTVASANGESYLVNKDSYTLYVNNKDALGPNKDFKTVCDSTCEKTWKPYLLDTKTAGITKSDDPLLSKINIFKRADGQQQYALGTQPLFLYSLDTKPGEVRGISADWAIAKP